MCIYCGWQPLFSTFISALLICSFLIHITYSVVSTCTSSCFLVACEHNLILYLQVSFLDSVPDIHIQEHVQEFIDGLFLILGDERKEIRRM